MTDVLCFGKDLINEFSCRLILGFVVYAKLAILAALKSNQSQVLSVTVKRFSMCVGQRKAKLLLKFSQDFDLISDQELSLIFVIKLLTNGVVPATKFHNFSRKSFRCQRSFSENEKYESTTCHCSCFCYFY